MSKLHMFCSYIQFHLNFKLKWLIVSSMCVIIVFRIFLYKPPACSHLFPYQSKLTHDRLTFDSTHFVQQFSEFVCPQNFRNLADWVYGWPSGVFDKQRSTTTSNGYYIAPCLTTGSIIFVKTDYLDKFFRKFYRYLSNTFVLITAQGDASSPDHFIWPILKILNQRSFIGLAKMPKYSCQKTKNSLSSLSVRIQNSWLHVKQTLNR